MLSNVNELKGYKLKSLDGEIGVFSNDHILPFPDILESKPDDTCKLIFGWDTDI